MTGSLQGSSSIISKPTITPKGSLPNLIPVKGKAFDVAFLYYFYIFVDWFCMSLCELLIVFFLELKIVIIDKNVI